MSNPPKKKGTAAETACVRWFHLHGFGQADRQPLRGIRDTGDIDLCPGIVVEVKAYRLPTGIPTPAQLALWLGEAAAEKRHAGARYCPLVVKRPGTADVGRWHAYLPLSDWALLTGAFVPGVVDDEPVMVTVATLTAVLRSCGYGDPLETVTATGWRWYQDCDHEDMLDVACDLHANEGGRRIHAAEATLAKVRGVAQLNAIAYHAMWNGDVERAFLDILAILDAPPADTEAGEDRE